jgi:outer membrane protein assembly factor BamB
MLTGEGGPGTGDGGDGGDGGDDGDGGDGGATDGGDSALPTRPDTIFPGTVERTGRLEGESVPETVGVEWSIPGINKGDHTAAKSSPLVYDGSVICPGDVGTVFSFTPEGGFEWATALHPSGNSTHATPAIAGGTIYTTGYDGAVYAMDAETGEMDWRTTVSDAIGSSPNYYDGKLYVATEFYTPSGGMTVLDAGSGGVLWEDNRPTNHCHSQTGLDPDAGVFAAGSNDGNLYVWDLDGPSFRGTFETGEPIKGPITMHEGRSIFGSWDSNVYAVDVEALQADWTYDTGGNVMAGVALHYGEGVAVTGSGDGDVHAIDLATGEERWTFSTGGYVLGSPVVAGDTVLAGSYSTTLYALDVTDGTEIWAFDEPDGFVTSSPAVHDGDVYVTARASDDETGHLYKLVGV